MDTNTQVGGFAGDPAEAFAPPAASGCCGGAFTQTTTAASGCCGSTASTTPSPDADREESAEATGCCG